jgi:hypothetical protein
MARWTPSAEEAIGANEQLGRRLFDEPLLTGAGDQHDFSGLDLRNFQEKRDNEYSLDRMGKSGIDRSVVSYLAPRATHAGTKYNPAKSFDGWAVIGARRLRQANPEVKFKPSPISGSGLEENPYHAHAVRPDNLLDIYFALHLRHLFVSHGTIHKSARSATTRSKLFRPLFASLQRRFVALIRSLT